MSILSGQKDSSLILSIPATLRKFRVGVKGRVASREIVSHPSLTPPPRQPSVPPPRPGSYEYDTHAWISSRPTTEAEMNGVVQGCANA